MAGAGRRDAPDAAKLRVRLNLGEVGVDERYVVESSAHRRLQNLRAAPRTGQQEVARVMDEKIPAQPSGAPCTLRCGVAW